MLAKKFRLNQAKDFHKLSVEGRGIFGPFLTLRVRKTKEDNTKVAFITSTKVFKRSVDRNRVKRRLRAIVRGLYSTFPANMHMLFVVKPAALEAPHLELVAEIKRLVTKIPEALTKPAKPSPGAIKYAAKRKAKQSSKSS